jgi:putative transcriptional regulator
MSKATTIAKMRPDGSVVEVLADGSERTIPDIPMRPMTPEEVEEAARADPNARPMTTAALAKARRVPRIKTLRRALGLTQEEFAARYRIPLGTLRDWSRAARNPTSPPAPISASSPTTPRASDERCRAGGGTSTI